MVGLTSTMKLIPLTQNKFAKVDDANYEWLNSFKWHYKRSACGNGYAVRKEYLGKGGNSKRGYSYRSIQMHRLIVDAPEGMDVDHKDGDGLNNSRNNLRVCTHMQNIHIGYFIDKEEAASVYNRAALIHHGEFARLNEV